MSFIYVGFGGFIGAVARYSSNLIFGSILGLPNPLATLFVNIFGSLLMGSIFYYTSNNPSEFYKLFFMTGVLGGFTTFSTFSIDTFLIYQNNSKLAAMCYILLTLFLSLSAMLIGMMTFKS